MTTEGRASIRVDISGGKAILSIVRDGAFSTLYASDSDGGRVAMGDIASQKSRGLAIAVGSGIPFALVDHDQIEAVQKARARLGIDDQRVQNETTDYAPEL